MRDQIDPLCDRPDEPEITEEMIEAGYSVLAVSGVSDELLEADRIWVREIYLAMHAARRRDALTEPSSLDFCQGFPDL